MLLFDKVAPEIAPRQSYSRVSITFEQKSGYRWSLMSQARGRAIGAFSESSTGISARLQGHSIRVANPLFGLGVSAVERDKDRFSAILSRKFCSVKLFTQT